MALVSTDIADLEGLPRWALERRMRKRRKANADLEGLPSWKTIKRRAKKAVKSGAKAALGAGGSAALDALTGKKKKKKKAAPAPARSMPSFKFPTAAVAAPPPWYKDPKKAIPAGVGVVVLLAVAAKAMSNKRPGR